MSNFYFMFHGLPGSGKSTMADALAALFDAEGLKYLRINRDNIRTDIAGEKYHSGNPIRAIELKVNAEIDKIMDEAFKNKVNVIDDNTNLNVRGINQLRTFLSNTGFVLTHVPVDVPVSVAKERNEARGDAGGRRVPGFVIDSMASKSYTADLIKLDRNRLFNKDALVVDAFSFHELSEVTLDNLFLKV